VGVSLDVSIRAYLTHTSSGPLRWISHGSLQLVMGKLVNVVRPEPTTLLTWQINVLDKTKMDWGEYKADQTVDVQVDLEQHKKSGATHLEQADFLARADVRQYEIERDQRLASSARNRGRL
jgi:hypothetical protein